MSEMLPVLADDYADLFPSIAPERRMVMAQILDRVATTDMPMHDVLASVPGAPSVTRFLAGWISNDEMRLHYAAAKRARAELLAGSIIQIADEATDDAVIVESEKGKPYARINGKAIRRAELMVNARKWAAAKLCPQDWGDSVDITSKGEALQGTTITHNHVTIDQRVQTIMTLAARRRDEAEAAARDMLDD